jgi:hypothetical protein
LIGLIRLLTDINIRNAQSEPYESIARKLKNYSSSLVKNQLLAMCDLPFVADVSMYSPCIQFLELCGMSAENGFTFTNHTDWKNRTAVQVGDDTFNSVLDLVAWHDEALALKFKLEVKQRKRLHKYV